jgi:hypothetical protein
MLAAHAFVGRSLQPFDSVGDHMNLPLLGTDSTTTTTTPVSASTPLPHTLRPTTVKRAINLFGGTRVSAPDAEDLVHNAATHAQDSRPLPQPVAPAALYGLD